MHGKPHLAQKSMLACVLQDSAKLRASSAGTGSGRMGGTSWTRGLWDTEEYRWTRNAARPSTWAAFSDTHFIRKNKNTYWHNLSMRIKLKVHDTKWKSDINRGNKCGFMHLVVKQVPESVYEAGEQLCVTKQSAHKPRGPWALSKDANN